MEDGILNFMCQPQGASFLQLLKISADDSSTFFYRDILSCGRTYENFDFDTIRAKNSFYCRGKLKDDKIYGKYTTEGREIKEYNQRQNVKQDFRKSYRSLVFFKVYLKIVDNSAFKYQLYKNGFSYFPYSANKKLLLGVLRNDNMFSLKKQILAI